MIILWQVNYSNDLDLLHFVFQVDMPVFFFIDPEFDNDPKLVRANDITLSYSFFEAKDGFSVPMPGFMQQQTQ